MFSPFPFPLDSLSQPFSPSLTFIIFRLTPESAQNCSSFDLLPQEAFFLQLPVNFLADDKVFAYYYSPWSIFLVNY